MSIGLSVNRFLLCGTFVDGFVAGCFFLQPIPQVWHLVKA